MVTRAQGQVANRTVDEIMNDDAMSTLLMKYKWPVAVVILLLVGSVLGYGIFSQSRDKKNDANNQLIYRFKEDALGAFQAGKVDAKTLNEKLQELMQKTGDYKGTAAIMIQTADLLTDKGQLAEAKSILEKAKASNASPSSYLNYLISIRLAAVYEDLDQTNDAIQLLESINQGPLKLMEGKSYLDLGRLYLKAGNKDKAKANLQHVVEKFKENNFDKMAQLYLEELDGQATPAAPVK